ncbi:MAG TPA: hypothetical protein VM712_03370 [Gaiellales bacterium]|jgi:hypothetical protein|nr:hypothetical protein [Gaiellales bacterium]
MQSHAHQIQALLAREHDLHARQVGLVRASLLSVPPRRPQMAQAGARAQASR